MKWKLKEARYGNTLTHAQIADLTNKRCNENNLNIIFTNINMNGKVKKERERIYYYRGLKEFESERGYLADICLSAQDAYKDLIRYFIGG